MRITAILLLSLTLLGSSCGKDENNGGGGGSSNPANSNITITFPTAGSITLNGTPLRVEGTVDDSNTLASVKVEVRNKATSAVYYTQTTSTGNVTFYRFLWNWTVSGISATTPAIVKITAKDITNAEISKEVEIILEN
jgi:hypothetical protein